MKYNTNKIWIYNHRDMLQFVKINTNWFNIEKAHTLYKYLMNWVRIYLFMLEYSNVRQKLSDLYVSMEC